MGSNVEVKVVSAQDVEALRSLPDVQVVDVRLPFDFFGGRVPNSINIPGSGLAESARAIPTTRKLILVCDDGLASLECARAAVAAGFQDVSVLAGGFDAWSDGDFPIETVSDGIPAPLSLKAEDDG